MARVYKHQTKARDGSKQLSRKWYIEYRDANGKKRRVVGFVDKRLTQQRAAELEAHVERLKCGILGASPEHASRPIDEHLEDYLNTMRSRGNTDAHVVATSARCRSVIGGAGVYRIADLTADRVEKELGRVREQHSVCTRNQYLTAVKGFARWLWTSGRCPLHPLASLSRLNPDADRRRVRRVLPPEVFASLLAATRSSGTDRFLLDPDARGWLYECASVTGLRANELATLTPESFDLKADPPSVSVEAGNSKHRRLDTLPLPRSFAARFAVWLKTRPPGQPVWPGCFANTHAAEMLREDLARAGIPYRDEVGHVYDFHALRSQYITDLVRTGASLSETQRLARHSTPSLTARHYIKLGLHDLSAATDRIGAPVGADPCSDVPQPSTDEQCTDGQNDESSRKEKRRKRRSG
jgi:integrase/recombinase XerD